MSSTLTKRQIEWAYKKWCEGYTQGEISEALYVSQNTVYRALKGKSRVRPKLVYNFAEEWQIERFTMLAEKALKE